jgi:UDPglucose 6-dehydrogenase
MKLGFIGQGWIGKNLADHFEERGFHTVRYAKEPAYEGNKDAIADCDIVFIAVPTPSTPEGFDGSILRGVIGLIGKGKIAIIKSTILPGTTDILAADHPDIFVLHGPEFLRETSVRQDIDDPDRNIIGIPGAHIDDEVWRAKAEAVMAILPDAPSKSICRAAEAELTKYGGNDYLALKVVFMNLLYDLAMAHNARWETIAENMKADPRIGMSHMQPVHQYAHMGEQKTARGAGGHCFIKDLAALRGLYEKDFPGDEEGIALFKAIEAKNNRLLRSSGKDLDLLEAIYGKIGDDIAGMEEALIKEAVDVGVMEKAYEKKDLPMLEAAYKKTGEDLVSLAKAYRGAGGDIETLETLLKEQEVLKPLVPPTHSFRK